MPKKAPSSVAVTDAPVAYQLWRQVDEESDGVDALLYSDAQIVGDPYLTSEAAIGPFVLYPTGADAGDGHQPAAQLTVRAVHADPPWSPLPDKPGAHWYLGMGADEEVAALLSLTLGVRLRSGGPVHRFPRSGDVHGVPLWHDHQPPGLVPVPTRRTQIPALRGMRVPLVLGLDTLARYPFLTPTQAFVLAKAARHFADALWIADSDPEQSWLRLVTAVEVVAVHHQSGQHLPLRVFAESHPETVRLISQAGAAHILPAVAEDFGNELRATSRFLAFLDRYAPGPPARRPADENLRVDWPGLRKAMGRIYGARSALLHEGTPFPPGMVGINLEFDDDGLPPECLRRGSQIGAENSAWPARDVPMYLWVFAHIVRGALINWWHDQTRGSAGSVTRWLPHQHRPRGNEA